jgi:hypothetical protein
MGWRHNFSHNLVTLTHFNVLCPILYIGNSFDIFISLLGCSCHIKLLFFSLAHYLKLNLILKPGQDPSSLLTNRSKKIMKVAYIFVYIYIYTHTYVKYVNFCHCFSVCFVLHIFFYNNI